MKHQKDGGTYTEHEIKKFNLEPYVGFPARVATMVALRCSECGDQVIHGRAIEQALEQAARTLLASDRRLSARQAIFLRKQMGKTQKELAELLEINRVTIANWERSKPISQEHDFLMRVFFLKHLGQRSRARVQEMFGSTVKIRPEPSKDETLVVKGAFAA